MPLMDNLFRKYMEKNHKEIVETFELGKQEADKRQDKLDRELEKFRQNLKNDSVDIIRRVVREEIEKKEQ